MRIRRLQEHIARNGMLATTLFAGLLVVVICIALYWHARPLLATHSWSTLLVGAVWMPSNGQFGLRVFLLGTFWVTGLAMLIAVPICLLAAIYLAEYAGPRTRAVVKPLVDLLAGIPSVVYGVWGVLVVVPFIAEKLGPFVGLHMRNLPLLANAEYTTGYTVLAAAIVLAIMISPVIVAIADEVLRAVPAEYREASLVLGATRLETVGRVVVRKALPGLVAAVIMGVSRALGETMAVLMVAGNVKEFAPGSIFDAAYPLPALIANNYGEMMSIPLYDAALLGSALLLLGVVVTFNVLARVVLAQAMKRLSA